VIDCRVDFCRKWWIFARMGTRMGVWRSFFSQIYPKSLWAGVHPGDSSLLENWASLLRLAVKIHIFMFFWRVHLQYLAKGWILGRFWPKLDHFHLFQLCFQVATAYLLKGGRRSKFNLFPSDVFTLDFYVVVTRKFLSVFEIFLLSSGIIYFLSSNIV